MHIAIAIGTAVVLTLGLVLVAGATPFVGIPLLIVALAIAAMFAGAMRRATERRLESDAPSSREASYDPVIDPSERAP
jgi:hypothetical protein